MLWIIGSVALVAGVLKISRTDSRKKRLTLSGGLIILELVLLFSLYWCFCVPMKGEQIQIYDVTNKRMFVSNDSISFSNTEQMPYSLRDMTLGYTQCTKVDNDARTYVTIYEETASTLKFMLSFKPEQNIVDITYNDNNDIIV